MRVTFGDILTIINGKNQKTVENPTGQYPIYGSGGVMGYADAFLCPEGTTVIGRKGTINTPIFVSTKFWNVDTAFGLVPNVDLLTDKYLYYFCLQYDFLKHNRSTTLPSLTKSDLLKIELPLPPLATQKHIADILDAADALRRKTQQIVDSYDDLAQSLFLEMFGDPVRNEKGWETTKLGNALVFITSGSRGWAQYYSNEGDIFLRIQNVGYDKLKLDDITFVCAPNSAEAVRTKVETGDIILSITADLGRTAVIPDNFPTAYINQHLSILRITKEYNPRFLSAYIASPGGRTFFYGSITNRVGSRI